MKMTLFTLLVAAQGLNVYGLVSPIYSKRSCRLHLSNDQQILDIISPFIPSKFVSFVNPYISEVQTAIRDGFNFRDVILSDDIILSPFLAAISVTSLLALSIAVVTGQKSSKSLFNTPYGSIGSYDPNLATEYFSNRPQLVYTRGFQIFFTFGTFGINLLLDYLLNRLSDPVYESQRAGQLTDILTLLGPTFIKIGQSLSIRRDLLRPAYLDALSRLQDKVPAFPTSIAREIIEQELGESADVIFKSGIEPTADVVAAASLGQVYKAVLRADNSNVAVKIQRPNIVEQVALDMHLLRSLAGPSKALFNLQSDLVGIVDDWGLGFVDELNYIKEAENAETFMAYIEKTPLRDAVFAPPVVREVSSVRVLTTRWVDGEKLDQSRSADVAKLCSVAMNAYLTMMLECPILHCDPHPGNLKRTPDGRLCILDWGLVTTLKPDLQLSYIEHIAHLTSKDYARVPSDLVKLGFVPDGKQDAIEEAGVVDVLTSVYSQFAGGGGAAKIDVNKVISEMTGLADTYGNLFQLPPYFAYIARAFGVLEGIGLGVDPDYAIVGECLPYISQRLLTDSSDRTGGALGTFIFGADRDKEDRVVDPARFELLIQGFGNYASAISSPTSSSPSSMTIATVTASPTGSTGTGRGGSTISAERIEQVAAQLVDLLVGGELPAFAPTTSTSPSPSPLSSPTGPAAAALTPLQRLALEELGKVLGAGARKVFSTALQRSGRLPSGRSVLGLLLDPLGLFRESALVNVDETDEQTLDSVRRIAQLLRVNDVVSQLLQNLRPADARSIVVAVTQRLWMRRRSIPVIMRFLSSVMLRQAGRRIEKSSRVVGEGMGSGSRVRKGGDRSLPSVVAQTADSDNDGDGSEGSGRLSRARAAMRESLQPMDR